MDKPDFFYSTEKTFRKLAEPDGRNLHWVTQLDEEIPIQMKTSGFASIPPQTFAEVLQNAVDEEPHQEAMRIKRDGKWQSINFAQYSELAHRFGRAIVNLGIPGRKCINILGFNTPEWSISYIGALLADCIPVGVYTTSSPEAIAYIAEHSEAQMVVVHDETFLGSYLKAIHSLPNIRAIVVIRPKTDLSQFKGTHAPIITWEEFMNKGSREFEAEVTARKSLMSPTKVATVIYTSGTTGPPKGVLLSQDNLIWTSHTFVQSTGVTYGRNEAICSYLPLSHVAGQMTDIIVPLYYRLTVSFADERALQGTLGSTLREVRPTFFVGVPRVYEKIEENLKALAATSGWLKQKISLWANEIGFRATLSQLNDEPNPWGFCLANSLVFKKIKEILGFDRCKILFVTSAPVSKQTLDFFASINIPLTNMYGMSECSGPMTTSSLTRKKFYSAGFGVPSTTVEILDEHGNILPRGQQGEISMKGRNKFLGYFKDPAATRACVDSNGFLHSGDKGYLDEEGFLYITGRYKELIITAGGENIPPVLIEQSIKSLSKLISNVLVVGEGRKYLVALITLKSELDNEGFPTNKLSSELASLLAEIGSNSVTVEQAVEDPKIHAEIERAISLANSTAASRAQHIRRWKIIPSEFTIPGGELTPTLKLKRKNANAKYSNEIETLYQEPKL